MRQRFLKSIKLIVVNIVVLLILLGGMELLWRNMGYTPGVFSEAFQPREGLQFNDYFRADSAGIIRYNLHSRSLSKTPIKSTVNPQGFLSAYDFDSLPDKKDDKTFRIMAVGDSYTDGCCLENRKNSFVGLLDNHPELSVYNFGVLGTDPLQYRLVVQEYIDQVQPDLILAFVYLGNDLMGYPRNPRPLHPIGQSSTGFGMVFMEIPFGDSIYRFDSPQESYDWQFKQMTLLDEDEPWLNRQIGKSALFTQLYYQLMVAPKVRQNDPKIHQLPHSANEISKMVGIAQSYDTDIMLMGVPGPVDVENQVDLKEEYQFLFGDFEWNYPDLTTFWKGDYDGPANSNHFNRFGYLKYYLYLVDILSYKYPEIWSHS